METGIDGTEALEGLTGAQAQAIMALLSEPTIKGAAKVARVGETTIHRWLNAPEFAAAYKTARRRVLERRP